MAATGFCSKKEAGERISRFQILDKVSRQELYPLAGSDLLNKAGDLSFKAR